MTRTAVSVLVVVGLPASNLSAGQQVGAGQSIKASHGASAARGEAGRSLDAGLVGYWRLAADCKDYSGHDNHGLNRGVLFGTEPPGDSSRQAGKFDGSSHIEVPHSGSLSLGTQEFSISVWIKCGPGTAGIPGDIIGKYDPIQRRGINLCIASSSSAYCSVSDSRNVHFGIDHGLNGSWVDCGRPWPSNTLISSLVVYKGKLYAGIADAADPHDACRVFRYGGGERWTDCGRLGDDPKTSSVHAMLVHKGHLYATSSTWDWEKVFAGKAGATHVYRYEGGTTWHDCGALGTGCRAMALASLDGDLYAADDTGRCYRYDGHERWTLCAEGERIDSMMAYHGHLYGGRTTVRRYDGDPAWTVVGGFQGKFNVKQIHAMDIYKGHLYAGTWPEGRILRYGGGKDWKDCGYVGIGIDKQTINEINDLLVYNGKLYAGVIPKAEVWRYDGDRNWTLMKQLVTNRDWSPSEPISWNRIPCMAVFQGRLYAGTSTCYGRADANNTTNAGKIFSWEVGKCVSYDDDLGTTWRHLVTVRERDQLRLYIDGAPVATRSSLNGASIDVSNNKPLLIGLGAQDCFRGHMRELRIYDRALSAGQVEALRREGR